MSLKSHHAPGESDMLYTRCPECETTFRITEHALQQARGQVRCGRCSLIFNAHDSLSETLIGSDEEDGEDAAAEVTAGLSDEAAGELAEEADAAAIEPIATAEKKREGGHEAGPVKTEAVMTAAEPASAAPDPHRPDDAVLRVPPTDTKPASTGRTPPANVDELMSANEIDAVLDLSPPDTPGPAWMTDARLDDRPRRTGAWTFALVAALVALVLQATHAYRTDLARSETLGTVIRSTYAMLGQDVVPSWDVTQYELLDWTAIEDPASQPGQRSLVIRSRLRNGGERAQPYPLIHLSLLDRWEKTVAARLFEPDEYIAGSRRSTNMMRAGDIVDTELVIVDPGTDAYGFELAVCLAAQSGIVCDTDATFR